MNEYSLAKVQLILFIYDVTNIVIIPDYSCSATLIISKITGIDYILLECL